MVLLSVHRLISYILLNITLGFVRGGALCFPTFSCLVYFSARKHASQFHSLMAAGCDAKRLALPQGATRCRAPGHFDMWPGAELPTLKSMDHPLYLPSHSCSASFARVFLLCCSEAVNVAGVSFKLPSSPLSTVAMCAHHEVCGFKLHTQSV